MMDKERRWFVGIDWGSEEHVVSLYDDSGEKLGQKKFAHGGTGLTDMIAWLLKASGGKPGEIHVAIETPQGLPRSLSSRRARGPDSISPPRSRCPVSRLSR